MQDRNTLSVQRLTVEASIGREITSLKRIQQCNQVFTCQQFQRYQSAHLNTHTHTANKQLHVVYHQECVCTAFLHGVAKLHAQLEAGAA